MFRGFDKDAIAFLHELTIEMNREWFEANKDRYKRVWVEPLTELLDTVAGKLAKTYAPVKLTPHVFRIYRDTRFSKDKAPYKTHVAGVLRAGNVGSGMYFHVETGEEWVGAGTYYFEDDKLGTWRRLVAADRPVRRSRGSSPGCGGRATRSAATTITRRCRNPIRRTIRAPNSSG
jgi:uncharacterized protein (TIGR02453 family)